MNMDWLLANLCDIIFDIAFFMVVIESVFKVDFEKLFSTDVKTLFKRKH